jgi:DNA invertase Pin-like site-specific DNA recombinase
MALRVVGYVRVSTEEQQDSGAGLEVQRAQIRAEASRRSWRLIAIREDAASGKSMVTRAGLQIALRDIESGGAEALVVAKLDRLSRSILDFASLMERSRRGGWALVALDLGVDTTTPQGEMVANVMASFAQFERKLIGQRTREALAVKRMSGVRLGRPPILDEKVRQRIRRQRLRGRTLAAIAGDLNADAVPTAHGGRRWHVSTVQSVLRQRSRLRNVDANAPQAVRRDGRSSR